MKSRQQADAGQVVAKRPIGRYFRPAWTAELRRIEAQILRRRASGVTWS